MCGSCRLPDYVILCRSRHVERHGNLWACIQDRMMATMLVLGHMFCLRDCLNNHLFATIMDRVYWVQHHAGQESSSEEESAAASSSDTDVEEETLKGNKDAILQIDADTLPKCTRCNTRVWQVIHTELCLSASLLCCCSCLHAAALWGVSV